VRVTTVVFSGIGGSRVGRGVGVGALDTAVLPAEVGVGVGVGVALGAAVVAIAAAVGEGEGPAAEPHDVIRITPAARIADRPVSNRTPIVVPPTSLAAEHNGWRTADDSRIRRGRPPAVLAGKPARIILVGPEINVPDAGRTVYLGDVVFIVISK
jgi:hypothetical protein